MAIVKKSGKEHALAKSGSIRYDMYGPGLFFPSTQLQRLVHGAHAGTITDLDSLSREIRWRKYWWQEYGPCLAVIQAHHPSPSPKRLSCAALESQIDVTNCSAAGGQGDSSVTEPQRIYEQYLQGRLLRRLVKTLYYQQPPEASFSSDKLRVE